MTANNKEVLIAKIDILWDSVGDPQLKAVIALMRDIASGVEISDKVEMGFGQTKAEE